VLPFISKSSEKNSKVPRCQNSKCKLKPESLSTKHKTRAKWKCFQTPPTNKISNSKTTISSSHWVHYDLLMNTDLENHIGMQIVGFCRICQTCSSLFIALFLFCFHFHFFVTSEVQTVLLAHFDMWEDLFTILISLQEHGMILEFGNSYRTLNPQQHTVTMNPFVKPRLDFLLLRIIISI
jgi:hypothetical protein